ncbi:hypothetical protein BDZ45DRAFT_746711 [Acephala macrosclerotiorum]|nr:hypothetical protein BDZ45DRAFT_746711 [Acephala macrosclerotiorum]
MAGNGEEPCQRCLDHSVDCEYADYVAPAKTIDATNVEQLETRMESMERLFRQFLEQFNDRNLGHPSGGRLATAGSASEPAVVPSQEASNELVEQESRTFDDDIRGGEAAKTCLKEAGKADSPPYCYADGFGELDTDTTGQLRYVGIGSTAAVVDTCVGLRRHIHEGLEKKGYEIEETFFASPEASGNEVVSPTVRGPLNSDIPPLALVDVLIDTYLRDLHFLFPIIPQDDVKSIYANVVSDRTLDTGPAAIFYAVLAVSTLLVPPTHTIFSGIDAKYHQPDFGSSLYALSLHFANASSDIFGRRRGKLQDIVVALGLLSSYLAAIGSQAEAWIMVGRAIKNGQDLGLHRSPERLQLPAEERSTRRYIWWCLYVLERQLCTALGRPISVNDEDCGVEIPSEASDGIQTRETAGFISLIYLHKILGAILRTVNSVKNVDGWREVTK